MPKPDKAKSPFKLSKKMRDELPANEKDKADSWLWEKSVGECALCGEPLPEDGVGIEPDHRILRSEGGETRLHNLFLAHKQCNRIRGDLPFDLGKEIVRFQAWVSQLDDDVQFDKVLKRYLDQRELVGKFAIKDGMAVLTLGQETHSAELLKDPATGTQYFFTEIPVAYIHNDEKSQPRYIAPDHVRALMEDFVRHPVHEPSNVRVEIQSGDKVKLLQFDGQHKTTAQILLGRKRVPLKVYVEPDLAMLQELVLTIQQGIKKRPLSTSDTLRKLGDVMKAMIASYFSNGHPPHTEKGLVEFQPSDRRAQVKKQYFQELVRGILFDDDCELQHHVSQGRSLDSPLSDRVAAEKLIRPMICPDLLTSEMEDPKYIRDEERKNVVFVLNEISDQMIENSWNSGPKTKARMRAQNFFYQGAIGWWVGNVLLPATAWGLQLKHTERHRPFLRKLTKSQRDMIRELVKVLCSWPIWSKEDADVQAALRSNTVDRVTDVFSGYDDRRLLKDAGIS